MKLTTLISQRYREQHGRITTRRRGQALVEFALVVPILLAILIGIIEFGWLTKNTMTISSAAREGARAAAVGKTTQEIRDRIIRYSRPIDLTGTNGSITMQQCDSTGANCTTWPADKTSPSQNGVTPPNMVKITLESRHRSLTGFIPGLTGRKINTAVTMRRES